MRFIKITQSQINIAGRFHEVNGSQYDLQQGKQKDGSFIANEETWDAVKSIPSVVSANIQEVFLDSSELDFEETNRFK